MQPHLSLGEDRFALRELSVMLAANVLNADSYTWQTPHGTITAQQAIDTDGAGTYGLTGR